MPSISPSSESREITKMELRIACLENISELMVLVHSAYRGEGSKKGWTTEADLLDGSRTNPTLLKSQIERENSDILICVNSEANERILGCVQVETALENGELKCHVGLLSVSPELQANGIGKKLLYGTHDWAKEHKCVALTMSVISVRKELIAWYERHGFKNTGQKEPFHPDPTFGTPKQELEFNIFEKRL